MKQKIVYWVIAILCIIGGVQVLSYTLDMAKQINAKFDSKLDYDLKKDRYDYLAKNAYGYGRFWGQSTAQSYELDAFDNYPYKKNMSDIENSQIALQFFERRVNDFECWGPDECKKLPDDNELISQFGIDFGSKKCRYMHSDQVL